MTMASEAAMNTQPKYTFILKAADRCPLAYNSGTARRVDAAMSFSKTPKKITGKEVKSWLKLASNQKPS